MFNKLADYAFVALAVIVLGFMVFVSFALMGIAIQSGAPMPVVLVCFAPVVMAFVIVSIDSIRNY